ncbi:TQO small subunit DoxD [Acidithiobacillus sp.]|uniref:TQO small subunit DoxD n=1 Tax=Acidithiobacillus sp. TaxID=1872118 RepID=UPI0025BE531B|nr:TQO small subunit DoxD [Acidithiobacillus sp.]
MSASVSDSENRYPPADRGWHLAAIALLAVRFVQGWIYWGGGSRRFIYGPQKLDVHGHWMAYKFQTAMPGALLGTDRLVAFLLHHFTLLYLGVIVFSAVELIAGLMLITGFLTRLAALATIGLSFVLMLLFGWQGATCIDEWTMASANFAMGVTLFLAGSGAYSIDGWFLRKRPQWQSAGFFRWFGGALPLPLAEGSYKRLALALFWITVVFVVATYDYYRGSVVTAFHGGPVSPAKHHWQLGQGRLLQDGTVIFHAYVDAGTAAEPSNVLFVTLYDPQGKVVERWDSQALSSLGAKAFQNDFPYQKIHAGPFGLTGPVGASAELRLPGRLPTASTLPPGDYRLELRSVNGHLWSLSIHYGG